MKVHQIAVIMSNIKDFQALIGQLHNKSTDILMELERNQIEPLSELHSVIKTKRVLLNMTQQEVADLADISLTTYKNIEAPEGNYTKHTLFAVLNVLGVQLCLKP